MSISLRFPKDSYTIRTVGGFCFRAWEGLVYCAHPAEPIQKLSLYAPECYFSGGEINGFSAQNAPIFLLNTVGGDVEAGLAIAELIASMTKPTVSIVLGGSHSIGIPLAVSAKRSFAVPSAAMTIHPVRVSGTVIAAPQTYSYFQRLQERIVAFVASNSRISAEKFEALMLKKEDMAADVGSVVYGEEAVELGLIDEVGGVKEGLQCLFRQIEEGKPAGK